MINNIPKKLKHLILIFIWWTFEIKFNIFRLIYECFVYKLKNNTWNYFFIVFLSVVCQIPKYP